MSAKFCVADQSMEINYNFNSFKNEMENTQTNDLHHIQYHFGVGIIANENVTNFPFFKCIFDSFWMDLPYHWRNAQSNKRQTPASTAIHLK